MPFSNSPYPTAAILNIKIPVCGTLVLAHLLRTVCLTPPLVPGLLLRVAKALEDDRPKFDYISQYRYYLSHIKPILGSYVLHQELVGLQSEDIIDRINAHLRSINKTRAPQFKYTYVKPSELGFLVEDMRSDGKLSLSPIFALCSP
jgi:hypothetical protein